MTTAHSVPTWQQSLNLLTEVVIGVVIIVGLQWGRAVLIPIALAVLLTFLLNPIVRSLHHRGLNRLFSVFLAVSTVAIVILCLGLVVTRQISGMLAELPRNTERIKNKVKEIKQFGSGATKDQIVQMFEEIIAEIHVPRDLQRTGTASGFLNEGSVPDLRAGSIVIQTEPTRWLSFTGYLSSAFEVLATLGFAFVLLVFFLIEREDLRDRIVLLAGRAKVTVTSKALEDVTDRVSHYIGMVALVNGGFGLILTTGLFALGVPFALLWGFVAASLRFLPYIGPWIGAVFPIALSFALSDGLWQPIAVFMFVTAVELVTNNVVEPLLFGHTIGVSPTALLVSAACWLFLWGPIGLVLSAPFAVCLVVLGKNITALNFLYILLGDKPALDVDHSFYQRLMLGDFHDAAALAVKKSRTSTPEVVFDEMLIPALNFTNRDVLRNHLKSDEYQSILDGMKITLSEMETSWAAKLDKVNRSQPTLGIPGETASSNVPGTRIRILGCAATNESDQFALELLQRMLSPLRWAMELKSSNTLTSELITKIGDSVPTIVFIASVPPGSLSHARYLCKRLRLAFPELQIVVGRFGQTRSMRRDRERLLEAGASFVVTSFSESRELLSSRLALLSSAQGAFISEFPIEAQITKDVAQGSKTSLLAEVE